jgi:hypothetical protein
LENLVAMLGKFGAVAECVCRCDASVSFGAKVGCLLACSKAAQCLDQVVDPAGEVTRRLPQRDPENAVVERFLDVVVVAEGLGEGRLAEAARAPEGCPDRHRLAAFEQLDFERVEGFRPHDEVRGWPLRHWRHSCGPAGPAQQLEEARLALRDREIDKVGAVHPGRHGGEVGVGLDQQDTGAKLPGAAPFPAAHPRFQCRLGHHQDHALGAVDRRMICSHQSSPGVMVGRSCHRLKPSASSSAGNSRAKAIP